MLARASNRFSCQGACLRDALSASLPSVRSQPAISAAQGLEDAHDVQVRVGWELCRYEKLTLLTAG